MDVSAVHCKWFTVSKTYHVTPKVQSPCFPSFINQIVGTGVLGGGEASFESLAWLKIGCEKVGLEDMS